MLSLLALSAFVVAVPPAWYAIFVLLQLLVLPEFSTATAPTDPSCN